MEFIGNITVQEDMSPTTAILQNIVRRDGSYLVQLVITPIGQYVLGKVNEFGVCDKSYVEYFPIEEVMSPEFKEMIADTIRMDFKFNNLKRLKRGMGFLQLLKEFHSDEMIVDDDLVNTVENILQKKEDPSEERTRFLAQT